MHKARSKMPLTKTMSPFLKTVSRQLALAIENANLYQQVSLRLQQQERAEALMRLQRDLLAGLSAIRDFQEILQVVLNTLTRIEGIDGGSIYLVDETGGLDMVAYTRVNPAFAASVSYLPPEAHKTQFVRQGRIDYMRYANLPFDPRIPAEVRSNENILCLAVLPIKYQSEVIADLTLCSHILLDIPLDARVVLESIAAQLGATIARIKTEKSLAANQAHNMALLEAIPDLILVLDSNGRLHRKKPGSEASPYLIPNDILGKRLHDFLPADDADYVLEKVREALATRQILLFQYNLFSEEKQGDEYFEARVSAVDEDQAILIIRNITDRRLTELEIENRDRKYRALFEFNKDAVLLFSIEGYFLEANQPAIDLLGYSQDNLSGMTYLQLVAPEEWEQASKRFAGLQSGEKYPLYQRTFLHKNGARIVCEENIAVVLDADGRTMHIQSILRNNSQPRQVNNLLD